MTTGSDEFGLFLRRLSVSSARCGSRIRSAFGGIAQVVEHRPFKPLVLGSSPSAPTIDNARKTVRIARKPNVDGPFPVALGFSV